MRYKLSSHLTLTLTFLIKINFQNRKENMRTIWMFRSLVSKAIIFNLLWCRISRISQINKMKTKQKNALLISWSNSNSLCDNWKKVLSSAICFCMHLCCTERQIDFIWFDRTDPFRFFWKMKWKKEKWNRTNKQTQNKSYW